MKPSLNSSGKPKKCKILCKYFMQGKCNRGEDCPYLHSQEKSKPIPKIECPMYTVGYCKNGPLCHYLHIQKDKYIEEEKGNSSSKEIDENQNNNDNKEIILDSNEKISENNEIDDFSNFPEIPIWYIEHYYDEPISKIYSELEKENLPEISALKKKYGFENSEENSPMIQNKFKKNKNTINFKNYVDIYSYTSNNNFSNNYNMYNTNINININNTKMNGKYDIHSSKKDSIEFLISKKKDIFYYLIRCHNQEEIKKSLGNNKINLPDELYNLYKDANLKKIIVIVFLFDNLDKNFAGFARLKYPVQNDIDENTNIFNFKIEWLWRTKLHFSKVGHLMNKADNDRFLNEGKNGCKIDTDLGNYCCRLMMKRLSKDEVNELQIEKKIFRTQMELSKLKKQNIINYDEDEDEDEYELNEKIFESNYHLNRRDHYIDKKKKYENRKRNRSKSRSRSANKNNNKNDNDRKDYHRKLNVNNKIKNNFKNEKILKDITSSDDRKINYRYYNKKQEYNDIQKDDKSIDSFYYRKKHHHKYN